MGNNRNNKNKKKNSRIQPHRPPNDATATVHRRAKVDKKIVDELLLVCGVIGTVDPNTNEFVPVHECLNWLQDLQRTLRRDDDMIRPISLLLGQWNVLPQKLLPLCMYSGRYDRPLLLTLCKILVILTKPLHEHTVRLGKQVINPKVKKSGVAAGSISQQNDQMVLQEQIWLRENAIQQANLLMDYKKAFCRAHQHLQHNQEAPSLFKIFVSLLAEPLGRPLRRTEQDHAVMELVLYLFIYLLKAQPLFLTGKAQEQYLQVHDELVSLMHQELVLDIVLVLAGDLEQPDNAPYNLLVLELLHALWKPYHPAAVARAVSLPRTGQRPSSVTTVGRPGASTASISSSSSSSLLGRMQRERKSYAVTPHTRHSHFGGTLQLNRANNSSRRPQGKENDKGGDKSKGATQHKYVSATQFLAEQQALTSTSQSTASSQQGHQRKSAFVPSGGSSRHSSSQPPFMQRQGPSAQRAQMALHQFLQRFVQDGYAPMAKSLKGEFRRDSVRLNGEDDNILFMEFIWFVAHWWRLQPQQAVTSSSQKDQPTSCIGSLLSTMDIFTLDLIFRSMDDFMQRKQYEKMGSPVAVWVELLHLLQRLFHSKDESDQVIALGLLDRLYYNSEPLDRLPRLLSHWETDKLSREYVADLVELVHGQLKLLDDATAAFGGTKRLATDDAAVQQICEAARDFDCKAYVCKRLVSPHSIGMYIELLEHFEQNSVTTNHRIVAFLKHRVAKQVLQTPQEDEEEDEAIRSKLLPSTTVTLQPLLYQYSLFVILERILSQSETLPKQDQSNLVPWATNLVHDFSQAVQRNPLLWMEALLLGPTSRRRGFGNMARHCDDVSNVYVSEEFRMLLLKDQLQQQIEEGEDSGDENGENNGPKGSKPQRLDDDDDDDEENEELEFEDAPPPSSSVTETISSAGNSKRRRTVLEEDSSDDEEDDTNAVNKVSAVKTSQEKKRKLVVEDDSEDESIGEGEIGNGESIGKEDTATQGSENGRNESEKSDTEKEEPDNELIGEQTKENDASPTSKTNSDPPHSSQLQNLRRAVLDDDSDSDDSVEEPMKTEKFAPLEAQSLQERSKEHTAASECDSQVLPTSTVEELPGESQSARVSVSPAPVNHNQGVDA